MYQQLGSVSRWGENHMAPCESKSLSRKEVRSDGRGYDHYGWKLHRQSWSRRLGVRSPLGGREKELVGSHPETTSNRMELTAAIEGVRALKAACVVHLIRLTIRQKGNYRVPAQVALKWLGEVQWRSRPEPRFVGPA